jgi:predicted site-specific integrase-resolvase
MNSEQRSVNSMRVITINEETGKRVYCRKEVADICEVSTQTIGLWEDAGRIPSSIRDENDYRYWDEDALAVIKEFAGKSIKERKQK